MDEHWETLCAALIRATAALDDRYFRLAVAGQANPIVRERAYCYELYHQLRLTLPDQDAFPFVLHGEVDKRGHPLLDDAVGGRNPDFIVHTPGRQGEGANLGVIEVKACGLLGNQPTKDADSLIAFLRYADYFKGIALVFGGNEDGLESHLREGFGHVEEQLGQRIEVFSHYAAGQAVRRFDDWWQRLHG